MKSLIVSLQRAKCIGCGYCEQTAPNHFKMSDKDGKSELINSSEKKGFYTSRINNDLDKQELQTAENSCPVRIISVKTT